MSAAESGAPPEARGLPTSIAQLREVTQPPEVRNRRNAEHWTAALYLRDLSPYLTRPLLHLGASANAVTVLMILTGWATASALLIPGPLGAILALVLGQLQMLFDCSDGEVARWRGTKSPLGPFLDAVGHYSTELLIALALGVRAAAWPIDTPDDLIWLLLGALLALWLVVNKALNDMVRVARAQAGLTVVVSAAEAAPRAGLLTMIRRAAKLLPLHRILHSVELTMLIAATAILGAFIGHPEADRWLLLVLTPVAFLVTIGHCIAIVSSGRLRA